MNRIEEREKMMQDAKGKPEPENQPCNHSCDALHHPQDLIQFVADRPGHDRRDVMNGDYLVLPRKRRMGRGTPHRSLPRLFRASL